MNSGPLALESDALLIVYAARHVTDYCTTFHRYPIFSKSYSVLSKVYTGYCGTSEISHLDCVQFSLTTNGHFATGKLYISPFLNLLINSLELQVALNVHNFIARYRYLSFIKSSPWRKKSITPFLQLFRRSKKQFTSLETN